MSQLLINEYLRDLAEIRKDSGSKNEGAVSEAFKDLLKRWGRQQKLHFSAQYEMKGVMKNHIRPDGALLHELRMPLGFWEAKDQKDDLDSEIQKKFRAATRKRTSFSAMTTPSFLLPLTLRISARSRRYSLIRSWLMD